MGRSRLISGILLVIPALLAWSGQARAQRGPSTLIGQVTDTSGAAVPSAAITVTNLGTSISRATTTGTDGGWTVTALDVGNYKVQAVKTGFRTTVQTGIVLPYEQTIRVNLVLSLGKVHQEVTVAANASPLNTTDAATGAVIDRRKVEDLPLNGRNFIQLTYLIPGTTTGSPGNGNTSFTGQGFAVSAWGQRDFNNDYTLDGIEMTETRNPSPAFNPSIDAIQEFTVKTGVYSAEYGYRSNAHVDIALKSGTNQFHGSAYEFLRNSSLDARNFFNPEVAPLRRNQFGGTFGGPVIKNQTFFFVAADLSRQRAGETLSGVVPTSQELQGDFSSSATPIIDPQSGLPFQGNIRRGWPPSRRTGRF